MSEPSSEAITAALKFCDQFEQTTMGGVGCHTLKDQNDIRARFTVGSLATYVATALDEFAAARVEAEREACAKVCDDMAAQRFTHAQGPYLKAAFSIRSRGKVTR